MALHRLLQALEREADDHLRQMEAEAIAAADGLRAEAELRLEGRRQVELAAVEAKYAAAAAMAQEKTRSHSAAAILTARAEALERVRTRAGSLLQEVVPGMADLPGLGRDLEGALAYLGSGTIVLRCSEAWRRSLAPLIEGNAAIRHQPDESLGTGAMLATEDGKMTVDLTLADRLAGSWPELTIVLLPEMEDSR